MTSSPPNAATPPGVPRFTVQRPSGGGAILQTYRETAAAAEFDQVTGLYAFASEKGARLLYTALDEVSSNWATAKKSGSFRLTLV